MFMVVRLSARLFAPVAPSVAPKGGKFTAPEATGTLAIQTTRVGVDGRVIESDGKTETLSTSWRSTRSRWPP